MKLQLACALLAATAIASPALADDTAGQDQVKLGSNDGSITFVGGVGYTFLRGKELVYDSGNRVSELFWDSNAPVVTGALRAELTGPWTLTANVAVGLSGDSHMKDYDWLDASPSYAFDDWSERSIHPNTKLDHYFAGDIALGRDFAINDEVTVNVHGGFKYTDVKWTASDGSYVYSDAGFRDDIGDFPKGRAISYQQMLPSVFLGVEPTVTYDAWTFSLLARGGLTLKAKDEDHHWMKDRRYVDKFGTLPFLSLSSRVEYAVTEQADFYLAAGVEQYFSKVGDLHMYEIGSGEYLASAKRGAGMELRTLTISGGFKVRF